MLSWTDVPERYQNDAEFACSLTSVLIKAGRQIFSAFPILQEEHNFWHVIANENMRICAKEKLDLLKTFGSRSIHSDTDLILKLIQRVELDYDVQHV